MYPFPQGGYRGPYSPQGGGMNPMQSQQPQQHYVDVNLRTDQQSGGSKMGSEEKVEIKNIVNPDGGGRGGDNGLQAAAMVAALGGRNERGFGGDGFGFGGGGGILGALAIAGLIGNRDFGRGGFDRGGDCCDAIGQQILLSKVGSVEAAVPLAGAQTTNAILAQTNELQGTLTTLALGMQNGFANVKDSVQNIGTANLLATKDSAATILTAITALGDKIDANVIADLQRQLAVAQNANADERHERRSRDVEVNVTQQVNQQQAQVQLQTQIGELMRRFSCLEQGHNQIATAVNRTIQFGTGNVAANTNTANNAH